MFKDRLKQLRSEAGMSQSALATQLFVSQQAVGKWETDRATPNPEMIAKIASIFNVSADYLLGKTEIKNTPAPEGTDVSTEIQKVLNLAKSMTPEGQAELLAYAEYLAATKYKPKDPE